MYRRWVGPIALFFGLPYAAVAVTLLALLNHLPVWLPALAVWWLKPLWDRLVMVPAGVLLFDPETTRRKMAGGLRRVLSGTLFAGLTWKRFSPYRAYLIPIAMYERLSGGDAQRRAKWLTKDHMGQFVGLTLLGIALEAVIALSLWSSIGRLLALNSVASPTTASPVSGAFVYNLVYLLVVLCVEPLYALSSFAIYLNRRTKSEGWDLQLAFSRLRARASSTRGKTIVALVIIALSLRPLALHAQPLAPSAAPEAQSLSAAQARFMNRAHEVLKGNAFGNTVVQRELRVKPGVASPPSGSRLGNDPFLALLSAEVLRILMLSIAGALVVVAIVTNRHGIARFARSARRSRRTVARPEPLAARKNPKGEEHWIDAAAAAWSSGRPREAIATLYRGSLHLAKTRYGITISESATERECLRVLERANPDPAFLRTFGELTRSWIRSAWAGIPPESSEFEGLCRALSAAGDTHEP